MSLTVDDLEAYLGHEVEQQRGVLLLETATQACESVVRPLPAGCEWIILDVAANAYSAPPGPGGAAGVGPFTGQVAPGGVFLSTRQRDALRRLSGRGAAFTIDMTPARSRWDAAREQWGERAMRSRW